MKKIIFLGLFMLLIQKSFSQSYYPGNGLTVSNDSFHLGGTMIKNTKFKGINGSTRYNFCLDTFGLLNYNANRVDFEGTDSVRLISNKLVKVMSGGDIQIGTTNSIVMDGNLWLKRYKKTSSNFGLLTLDTCGRLQLSSDLEANKLTVYDDVKFSKYKKTSLNSGYLTVDTSGKLGISTEINLDNYLKLGGNDAGYNDISFGTTSVGNVSLRVNNKVHTEFHDGYETHYGNIWLQGYGLASDPAITIYNTLGQGKTILSTDGVENGGTTFGKGGMYNGYGYGLLFKDSKPTNSTNWDFLKSTLLYYGDGRYKDFSLLHLNPVMIYDNNDSGTYRGLFIDPYMGGTHDFLKERFRSMEITTGHILLNSVDGGTGIGVADTVNNSAILELKSTTKGLLLPRMTTSNRNNIANAATGLMLYNTDSNWVEIKKPEGWYKLLNSEVNSGGGDLSRTSNQQEIKSPSSFVTRIGDGASTVFNIKHNLNSEFVMVQFIDCGAEANCNLLLSIPEGARLEINGKDEVQLTFKKAPAFNRYKVMFLKIQ